MSLHLHGTRVDESFAELDISGGRYPEDEPSTYLTWLASAPLKPGDLLEVTLQDEGETLHTGKTIEELFPEESISPEKTDFRPTADMFAELRAKARLRSGYSFSLTTSDGISYTGRTSEDEYGFGFSVLWNSYNPARARFSLHSYTLDSLEQRSPGRYHVSEHIQPFALVRLRVDI